MPQFSAAALANFLHRVRQIFDLFWTQFLTSHTIWDGHEDVKYSGKQPQSQCIHPYYEATDTFRGLFFQDLGQKHILICQKARGSPDKLSKFSYLRQIELK